MVGFPPTEDGGSTFDVPISWHDLREMLMLPQSESRLRPSVGPAAYHYLSGEKLDSYAATYDVDKKAVFLNATPLIVNAARKFVPMIRPFIDACSLEARLYLDHFDSVLPADTHTQVVDKISIFLPS